MQFFKKYGDAVASMLLTAGRLISAENAADRIVEFFQQEFGQRFPDAVYEDLRAGFRASWQQGQNFPVRKNWEKLPVPTETIDWFSRANHFDVSQKMSNYDAPIRAAVLEALASGKNADRLKVLQEKLGETLKDPPLRNHLENIFRNLSSRASVFSRVQRYEALGIKEIEIVAIMDRRTSALCKTMNGRRISVQTVSEFVDEFTGTPYDADFWGKFKNPPESAFRGELDRLGTKELIEKKLNLPLPPYHFRCRTTTVVSEKSKVLNRKGQELKGEIQAPPGTSETNRHYDRFEDWKNLRPDEVLSKVETAQKLARWDAGQLDIHFAKHGSLMGLKDAADYAALSKKVLREFDRFLLYQVDDASSDQRRLGFYNAPENIFVAVDESFNIRTMFPLADEQRKRYMEKMVKMR